jgi:hypothetical protein
MAEIKPNELIINARGETRRVSAQERTLYHDKQIPIVDEARVLRHLQEARALKKEMDIGQREATVEIADNGGLPALIWLICDTHLGSKEVDYDAFINHYELVLNTPGAYAVSNGDEIDNFMVHLGGAATGVYETPITPEQQARLVRKMWRELDERGKLLAMSYGNHNDWVNRSGYTFENTWLSDFNCPILNCGGILHIKFGDQTYDMAISHQHWGNSKLNPTNMNKRFMEHEYPEADIFFLGHTHQKECLQFERGGKRRTAVVGGTYKIDDEWAMKRGISSRGQLGGATLAIYPDNNTVIPFYYVEEAMDFLVIKKNLQEIEQAQKRR